MSRKVAVEPTVSHDEATVASLRRDPAFAAAYLEGVLEDGDQKELLMALNRLARAFGGVAAIAAAAGLNATSLYRALSPGGNPELRSLFAVLKAMGLRLSVKPAAHRQVPGARAGKLPRPQASRGRSPARA